MLASKRRKLAPVHIGFEVTFNSNDKGKRTDHLELRSAEAVASTQIAGTHFSNVVSSRKKVDLADSNFINYLTRN